jgi:hypothetical protein
MKLPNRTQWQPATIRERCKRSHDSPPNPDERGLEVDDEERARDVVLAEEVTIDVVDAAFATTTTATVGDDPRAKRLRAGLPQTAEAKATQRVAERAIWLMDLAYPAIG